MHKAIEIIRMPKFGMSMTAGKVTEWYFNEGDSVDAGDEIVEVSTEKITNGVCCNQGGILRRILIAIDDTVAVETPLAVICHAETSDTEIDQALKNG